MTMAVLRSSSKPRDDNFRTELPNNAHEVPKHLLVTPFFEGFIRALGESKLIDGREELLPAIGTSSGEQLFGSNDTQSLEQLGPQQVLSAITSCCREVSGPHPLSAGKPS